MYLIGFLLKSPDSALVLTLNGILLKSRPGDELGPLALIMKY